MKIEVFGKEGCALCQSTKRKLQHFIEKWEMAGNVEMTFVNLETEDGMAEAAFRDVTEIPTTIVSDGTVVTARWEHEIPPSDDVRKALEAAARV